MITNRQEVTMSLDDRLKTGLRERKKIKTRAVIQQHALRLFREQGYNATTVEQISEAAEISPSTFFRYFPTKEAVVLEDDYDPLLIQAFQEQPSDLNPIQALRKAMASSFSMIPKEELEALRERMDLAMSIPELRAASLNQLIGMLWMIAELVADRIGCDRNDFHVLTFAGSVIGAAMSVQVYFAQNPDSDYAALFDQAMAYLEAGLPLPT
jgi:AcrR family transcriptional regulator